MKDIVKGFIDRKHTAPWSQDESAKLLVAYVYNGGVWDADFRNSIQAIRKKAIVDLELPEVFTYLTFIVCMDRTQEGCIDAHIANGTVHALLRRYLMLTEEAAR